MLIFLPNLGMGGTTNEAVVVPDNTWIALSSSSDTWVAEGGVTDTYVGQGAVSDSWVN